MIPLATPNLGGNEGRYLQECVETTFVSSVGPFVDRFESVVAATVGAEAAVATSAGTTGLHAALVAVGVKRDDLVILPSFTFIASANAIAHAGAMPWLFDISPQSWTLDATLVAAALERETRRDGDVLRHVATGRRVAAIMPVYTLGMPADMDPLLALARDYGLPVVADAAAAIGALYKGQPVGAIGADLSVFSFNGNKTVTAGGGGAVVGNDGSLVTRVRHLTTTARVGADYTHDEVGFNYRMTNLQAAVGCAQMERVAEFVARKRAIARRYAETLCNLPGVAPFPEPGWAESACWFSGMTVSPDVVSLPELRARLRETGIDARPFWKPVHLQRPYAEAPRSAMPVCEALWPTVLTLPCSTHLRDDEQEHVIDTVKREFAALSGRCRSR